MSERAKEIATKAGVSKTHFEIYDDRIARSLRAAEECRFSDVLHMYNYVEYRYGRIMDEAREGMKAGKINLDELGELAMGMLTFQVVKLSDRLNDITAEKCGCKWTLPPRRRM